jgi:Nif-specific regulatory protein
VRVVAATNRDVRTEIREKRFREDLFFRLNVVSLELPPLRERGDDVLLLADFFLQSFCRNMGRARPQFTPAARKRMLEHPWPGNVRELRNLMERLAYLTSGDRIEAEDLAFINAGGESDALHFDFNATLAEATQEFQQKYIKQTIDKAGGNMSKAAKKLGLHRSNLYRKMRQLEMGVSEEESEE